MPQQTKIFRVFVSSTFTDRESKWTESIAVGDEAFLENIRHQLNIKAKSRKIMKNGESDELSEPFLPYHALF